MTDPELGSPPYSACLAHSVRESRFVAVFNMAVSYDPEVGFDISKYAGKGDGTARGNSVVGAHFG